MPAINGTYAVDAITQGNIQAELWSIALNGTFATGGATVAWPDAVLTGVTHVFPTTTLFKTFATAIASFVANCAAYANGSADSLPSSNILIG